MSRDNGQLPKALGVALAAAKRKAPEASVSVRVSSGRSANVRFARDEVTSSAELFDSSVSVYAQFGRRGAGTSSNQLDTAAIEAAVDQAIRMARLTPEDPEAMPLLGPQKYRSMPSCWDEGTATCDAAAREALMERAVQRGPGPALQLAGFLEVDSNTMAMGSSSGLRASHASTGASLSVTARTVEGAGSGWAQSISHRFGEIAGSAVGRIAQDKALRSQKPTALAPGRYTVILEPAAVAELLSYLVYSMDARSADEGRSFFAKAGGGTKLNDTLFGPNITIRSPVGDPRLPCAAFTYEGLPVEPITWIDKGQVKTLSYSRFWAQKQGKAPTAQSDALELLGGEASSPEELLKGVKQGLLITRFWYTNMLNPETLQATGLTRDGVFLVENGEITRPVTNFRFNESPITMLKNADALTRETTEVGNSTRVPALRTHEFNLASASEAV